MTVPSVGMPNYIRPRIPGATIFFTVTLLDRRRDLLVRHIDLLRDAVRMTRADRPFHIDAWVVLPDHMHCVWTLPEGDVDYSTRWRLIKARFSRQLEPGRLRASHIRRRERGIWQRRFWEHHIRGEDEYLECVSYCWTNPVKHGLVGDPEDWPYSSWHRDVGQVRDITHPTVGCVLRTHRTCPTPLHHPHCAYS